MIKRFCNICKKEIQKDDYWYEIHVYKKGDIFDQNPPGVRADICEDCTDEMMKKLEGEKNGKE